MKFSEVIGNRNAIARIRRMIDSDTLPHALLLHGDAGVPKLALALAATQYLHCTNRHDGDSCGACPNCLQMQSHNHADTFFSFPFINKKTGGSNCDDFITEWNEFIDESPVESYERWLELIKNENSQPQILVKESDNILRKMSLTAMSSRYKVLVMWLPEKLGRDTANKLLKLIEEPAEDCKFILVSDDARSILPTIFSRTQRIELLKPSTDEIARYLMGRYGIDEDSARVAASGADGNVSQAERSIRLDSETKTFHGDFMTLMRTAYVGNTKQLLAWSESVAQMKREKSRRFLDYCTRMLRENFIFNLRHPELNYMTRDERAFSEKFSPFINAANVEQLEREFSLAARDIAGNANGRIVLFDLAIKVARLIKLKP